MTVFSDVLILVLDATNIPVFVLWKSTLTDVTHSGGSSVFQVTLTPGLEPPTLSALTVTP